MKQRYFKGLVKELSNDKERYHTFFNVTESQEEADAELLSDAKQLYDDNEESTQNEEGYWELESGLWVKVISNEEISRKEFEIAQGWATGEEVSNA